MNPIKQYFLSKRDKQIIHELYEELSPLLYNVCHKILNRHADSEDAVAETFLKITKQFETLSKLPYDELKKYCVVIARNESINILRKNEKITYTDSTELLDYHNTNPNHTENPEESAITNLEHKTLWKYTEKLAPDDKKLLKLRFYEGLTHSEIADKLGIKASAERVRYHRIMEKLRAYYEEGNHES